jgi:hypothetical protein
MNNNQEPTMEEKFRYNAELLIKIMHEEQGVILGYNANSIAWLDNYVEQNRRSLSQEIIRSHNLISLFGSFLGEAIRHEFGGKWQQVNGQWAIVFNEGNACFPINKVDKQFANGHQGGDSISSFYNVIPTIFKLSNRRGN